jgi:hypothetical protein
LALCAQASLSSSYFLALVAFPLKGPVMTFTLSRPYTFCATDLLIGWGRSARAFWARRHLTPQERTNLQAGYTPVGIYAASLGGGMHFR